MQWRANFPIPVAKIHAQAQYVLWNPMLKPDEALQLRKADVENDDVEFRAGLYYATQESDRIIFFIKENVKGEFILRMNISPISLASPV